MMSEIGSVKPHTTVTVSTDPTQSQSLEIRYYSGRSWITVNNQKDLGDHVVFKEILEIR